MKKLGIVFPDGSEVTAELLEGQEQKLADRLWEDAGKDQDYLVWQDICAGFRFDALPVPEIECQYMKPEHPVLASLTQEGDICFDGYRLRCVYGKVTIPLTENFGLVAKIAPECMAEYKMKSELMGKEMLFHHKIVKVKLRRKEA